MSTLNHKTALGFRVALFFVAIGYSTVSSASIIALDFVVEVTKRELHNGPGGVYSGFNWVEDTGYGGEQFELSFQIDTDNIQSTSGLGALTAEAPLVGFPATPFDAEIDDAFARWGWTTNSDPNQHTWHPLPKLHINQNSALIPPDALYGGVSITNNFSKIDGPDPYQSTSGVFRDLYLETATDFLFVTLDDLLNGNLITEGDLQRVLNELQSPDAPLFTFTQKAGQWQGSGVAYYTGSDFVEGVQYTGTARVKPASIPNPATSWLLLAGILGTLFLQASKKISPSSSVQVQS